MKEAEAILQRTNGGLRVFEHFFGETVRKNYFLILSEETQHHHVICTFIEKMEGIDIT